MFKAILFDMDGVLVDVSGSYRLAIEETAAAFIGRPLPPGAVQQYKNRGGFNCDWKLTHALITDAGIDAPFDAVVEAFQMRYRGVDWDGLIASEPPLVPASALGALHRGRVFALVTGRPEAEARWTLTRLGLEPFFPVVVAMEQQEGRGKPDPYGLTLALEALSHLGRPVDPEEAVYVGDTVDDMVAARAAGMKALGYVPPYLDADAHATLLHARGAHRVVRHPEALPPAVAALERA